MPQEKTYQHITRWTRPSHYMGATWENWYSAGVGQSRDSDALERANFDAVVTALKALPNVDVDEDGGVNGIQVVHESHWAVGWVEWIAIHETDLVALALADEIQAKLEDYPVVDEELFSEYEDDECKQVWRECYDSAERLAYFRKHSWSKGYGACGDSPLVSLLQAIKHGSWAHAANLLNCPSDLLS